MTPSSFKYLFVSLAVAIIVATWIMARHLDQMQRILEEVE
jgi:hypothetical protein